MFLTFHTTHVQHMRLTFICTAHLPQWAPHGWVRYIQVSIPILHFNGQHFNFPKLFKINDSTNIARTSSKFVWWRPYIAKLGAVPSGIFLVDIFTLEWSKTCRLPCAVKLSLTNMSQHIVHFPFKTQMLGINVLRVESPLAIDVKIPRMWFVVVVFHGWRPLISWE